MGGACSKGLARHTTVAPEEASPPQQAPPLKTHKAARRGSVSAEAAALSVVKGKTLSIPKPGDTCARLKQLIKCTLLFHDLDDDQEEGVISALFERKVSAGEVIIREGEQGDNFYLIERGRFLASKGGELKFTYDGRGSFGELALMYNCPRAATVVAETEGTLWGMDRTTFRAVIVSSMVERRQRYEATLQSMGIFEHLSPEQLAAIADCLTVEQYEAGEHIIWESEELATNAKFYMIESGTVECLRTFEGKKRLTKTLGAGDVFGEVALLTKAPRQADCVAATKVKCLTMSRDAFERLMGPVEQSLAQHIAEYNQLNADTIKSQAASRVSTPGSHATTSHAGPSSTQSVGAPTTSSAATSAATSRAASHQQEGAAGAGAQSPSRCRSRQQSREEEEGARRPAVRTVMPGSMGKAAGRVPAAGGEQGGSPSKLAAQIQEWERRLSGSDSLGSEAAAAPASPPKGTAGAEGSTVRRSKSNRGANSAEGGEAAVGGIREADEAKRIVDLVAQVAEAQADTPACTLEPIVEDPLTEGAAGSRRATAQH